jgi:hypothetical protein
MATFMIFDFGENEDAAQQAKHRVDGWRQGFRLDKKLQLKFDRADRAENAEAEVKSKKKKEDAAAAAIKLIVRLDFSDHEKLSHQRWVERIPADDLFKSAKSQIIPPSDPQFKVTAEHFAELD